MCDALFWPVSATANSQCKQDPLICIPTSQIVQPHTAQHIIHPFEKTINQSLTFRFDVSLLRVALHFIGQITEHVPGGMDLVQSHDGAAVRVCLLHVWVYVTCMYVVPFMSVCDVCVYECMWRMCVSFHVWVFVKSQPSAWCANILLASGWAAKTLNWVPRGK